MKKALLFAIFYGLFLMANAQNNSGITISPIGATPTDAITITIDPDVVCSQSGLSFSDASIVRLHAGVTVNGTNWTNVVMADGTNDEIVGFTRIANGKWSKTLIPEDYFEVPASLIEALNFVFNGGPANDAWSLKGGYQDPITKECGYAYVGIPIMVRIVCLQFPTSTHTILDTKQIGLCPNPAHDILNIKTTEAIRSAQVYDLLGRVQKTLLVNNNRLQIADLPTGIYMLRVVTPSGYQVMRWYKE